MKKLLPGNVNMAPATINSNNINRNKSNNKRYTNQYNTTKPNAKQLLLGNSLRGNTNVRNNDNNSYDCKVCGKTFESMQDCLKHELLQHTDGKMPTQRGLRNKLNSVLKGFTSNDIQGDVRKVLATCTPGTELAAVCKYYALDMDNLEVVYSRIHRCLSSELQEQFNLYPFGSIVTGLALRDSDIDIYLESIRDSPQTPQVIFNRVNSLLRRSKCFDDVIAIRSARVPIIKCKHGQTGFSLDINMSSPSSIHNSQFLRKLMHFDDRLHKLMLFTKMWAKQMHIIGRGDMTSYCLVTLILFFLQQQSLLPSIRELQANCEPDMILGINYAYNLHALRNWPDDFSADDLIMRFFNFYNNFEFKYVLISPFLGRALPLNAFINGDTFPEFEAQKLSVQQLTGNEPEMFQLQRCVCIQDPFSLSHNVAKSISPTNLIFFRKQLAYAARVCNQKGDAITAAMRYEKLLFGGVEEMLEKPPPRIAITATTQKEPEDETSTNIIIKKDPQRTTLHHTLNPSRADIRAITNYFMMNSLGTEHTIYYYWMKEYVSFIKVLVCDIFCLDMQRALNKHTDKHQRMDDKTSNDENKWEISTAVDMWSGRNHQRVDGQTYLSGQIQQTVCFQKQRRQNANYAVELRGLLTLHISDDYKQIVISVKGHDHTGLDLQRNSPLTKFFAAIKVALQGFKLKDVLEARSIQN